MTAVFVNDARHRRRVIAATFSEPAPAVGGRNAGWPSILWDGEAAVRAGQHRCSRRHQSLPAKATCEGWSPGTVRTERHKQNLHGDQIR